MPVRRETAADILIEIRIRPYAVKLLFLLIDIDDIRIVISGIPVDKIPENKAFSNPPLTSQNYNLMPILSVKENITLPLKLDGMGVDKAFLNRIVDSLGLRKKLNDLPEMLSGGQQQRVAIARALSTKPAVILADEPTGNLDSVTGTEVVGLLRSSAAAFHQTIVVVTHNEEIAQMADRMIRIEDGKVR